MKPALAAFGFVLAAAFVPGISGAGTAPRWALLSVALPLIYLFARPIAWTRPMLWGGAYFVWALVTALWSPIGWDALNAGWMLILTALAFRIGGAVDEPGPLYAGIAAGLGVSAAVALAQLAGAPLPIGQVAPPAGLFINKNFLAEIGLLVLILCLARRWWVLASVAALCAFLPLSRAALVGALAVLIAWRWPRGWALRGLLLFGIAVAGAGLALWHPASVDQRFDIWANTLIGLRDAPWLGHGLGSYRALYPLYAQWGDVLVSRPEHAHNDYLEIAFEHGIVGLALFGCFAGSLLRLGRCLGRSDFHVLLAVLVLALFAFPLRNPATAFMAAFVAGSLARRGNELRLPVAGFGNDLRARHRPGAISRA